VTRSDVDKAILKVFAQHVPTGPAVAPTARTLSAVNLVEVGIVMRREDGARDLDLLLVDMADVTASQADRLSFVIWQQCRRGATTKF
jgi:hypothetical protein